MKTKFTSQETLEWWRRTIADGPKFSAWLQKLYQTELSGYTDHLMFLSMQGSIEERTAKVILNIAMDELKHAQILARLMADRGIPFGAPPKSSYWAHMNSKVKTLADYCAVNHFGEELAAFRFEVIAECKDTPTDFRDALDIILPDEQFHMVTLKKLAGEPALLHMRPHHEKALANLARINGDPQS